MKKHGSKIYFLSVIILFFALFGLAESSDAANRYVRAGATGAADGTDWTNAYTALPASLVRGDTYYIADGTYGGYTFDDPVSGTTYIYLKKATVGDHGTDIGWSDTYGVGEVIFSSWTVNTRYYDIDGQVGGGPGSWDSGFGFKVSSTRGKRIVFNINSGDTVIRHTEARNSVSATTGQSTDNGAIVYAYQDVTNITFSYSKLHYTYGAIIHTGWGGADNWVIEYSKLGDNTGDSAYHSEIWSAMGNDNITLRYNWFFKWRSTGGIIAINGGEGQFGDSEICEDWFIFGNVFQQDGTTASWVIAAINDSSNQQVARRWKIYNNTFVDLNSTSTWVYAPNLSTYGEANNEFSNNIFYGNTDGVIVGGVTEDYNSYQGSNQYFTGVNDVLVKSDPFLNYGAGDYRLSAPRAGVLLSPSYNKDLLGNTRGVDGIWDRGAFEYAGPVKPSPPSGLTVQ